MLAILRIAAATLYTFGLVCPGSAQQLDSCTSGCAQPLKKPEYLGCKKPLEGANERSDKLDDLRIGVRTDARPFSYHSSEKREVWSSGPPGQLALRNYTGYINKICDAVLADMMLSHSTNVTNLLPLKPENIQVVDVDCLTKEKNKNHKAIHDQVQYEYQTALAKYQAALENCTNQVEKGGASTSIEECRVQIGVDPPERPRENPEQVQSRLEFLGPQIDILCDPTTISNARRHDFIISPPVFLTGIGMIKLRGEGVSPGKGDCPIKPLIGYVGNTNAGTAGLIAVLDARELSTFRQNIIEYINGSSDICKPKNVRKGSTSEFEFIVSKPNHTEAAKAFCNNEFHYYLGDREIISANAQNITGCEIEGAGRTYSDDRYAIFGRLDETNQTRALRTARFFEILSQKIVVSDSVLDSAFKTTFIGAEPSDKLVRFFWNIRGP